MGWTCAVGRGGLNVLTPLPFFSGLSEAGSALQRILQGHTSSVIAVAISSDGKLVVTGSYDNTARVWRIDTGETVRVLESQTSYVCAALFINRTLAEHWGS